MSDSILCSLREILLICCWSAASVQAFDSLLRKLQKYVPYGAAVADLYAGAGVIGLSLAATRKCRQELRWFKFSGSLILMSN